MLVEDLIRERRWRPIVLPEPLPLDAVPTPALLLDEQKLRRNVAAMAGHLAAHGKGARPHAKTHKCPLIARLQLDAGALGVCVAKISEGWALSLADIRPLLITSPVTSVDKARSLARLATRSPGLAVVVDSELGVDVLAEATREIEARVSVLIDLDPEMGRTGVREASRVFTLAERIMREPLLELVGVQHYAGHVMHEKSFETRRERSLALWARASTIVDELARRGFAARMVTGGGTGTYDIDCEVPSITDLQVGSYIFMDRQYGDIEGRRKQEFDDFDVSLTVAARVISQPRPEAATVDCGFKAMASDAGSPTVRTFPGARYRFAGDEHGVLLFPEPRPASPLGQLVELVVSHCDPTVNLYDHYWVHRDGHVRELWPITARGCSW